MDNLELNLITLNNENVQYGELSDNDIFELIELLPILKYTNLYIKSRLGLINNISTSKLKIDIPIS